jgi:hypothetical protein
VVRTDDDNDDSNDAVDVVVVGSIVWFDTIHGAILRATAETAKYYQRT